MSFFRAALLAVCLSFLLGATASARYAFVRIKAGTYIPPGDYPMVWTLKFVADNGQVFGPNSYNINLHVDLGGLAAGQYFPNPQAVDAGTGSPSGEMFSTWTQAAGSNLTGGGATSIRKDQPDKNYEFTVSYGGNLFATLYLDVKNLGDCTPPVTLRCNSAVYGAGKLTPYTGTGTPAYARQMKQVTILIDGTDFRPNDPYYWYIGDTMVYQGRLPSVGGSVTNDPPIEWQCAAPPDNDGDGIPDGLDPDDDNDGIPDADDITPNGRPSTGQAGGSDANGGNSDGGSFGGSTNPPPPPPTDNTTVPPRPGMPSPSPDGGGYLPPDDLYAVIRNALNDEGNSAKSSFEPNPNPLRDPDPDQGKAPEMEGLANEFTGQMDQAKTSFSSKISSLVDVSHLPTNIGTVQGVNLGSISSPGGGPSFDVNISFDGWQNSINLLRNVILFCMGAIWLYQCIALVRGALS